MTDVIKTIRNCQITIIHGDSDLHPKDVDDIIAKYYSEAYIKDKEDFWWDGYENQDVVVINDFNVNYDRGMTLGEVVNMINLDRGSRFGKAAVPLHFTHIVLFCDDPPEKWVVRQEDLHNLYLFQKCVSSVISM